MKKGRTPRQDEYELWQKVAKTADRLHPGKLGESETSVPEPSVKQPVSVTSLPSRLGVRSKHQPNDLAPSLQTTLSKMPVLMDKKAFGKMSRGRLDPEARLDLHGMTLDRAHVALSRFILSQHASGKRLVLVITGKGKSRDEPGPIPVRFGVLRHQVPQWLALAPLSGVVLQVSQAHQKHGGSGAYYVYLRRQK